MILWIWRFDTSNERVWRIQMITWNQGRHHLYVLEQMKVPLFLHYPCWHLFPKLSLTLNLPWQTTNWQERTIITLSIAIHFMLSPYNLLLNSKRISFMTFPRKVSHDVILLCSLSFFNQLHLFNILHFSSLLFLHIYIYFGVSWFVLFRRFMWWTNLMVIMRWHPTPII